MEERECHLNGKMLNSDVELGGWIRNQKYRTSNNRLKNQPVADEKKYPSLSDEFLNEYIPENLSTNVTWKDVLACGMIPEQRFYPESENNIIQDYLREDIRYLNQCLPEEPSPEPAPAPGTPPTSNIIVAEEIPQYTLNCEKEDDKIIITYINNENNDKYIFHIVKDSDFWNQYGIYFQNNLVKCYDVLMMTFTENDCNVKWKIKEKKEKNIILNISCEDMVFGFSIDIVLDLEEKHIEKLEKKVQELEKKVEKYDQLEDKVRSLCEYITYKETIQSECAQYGATGHDNTKDWDIPMEEPGPPKYNELSQTRSGYRKEIWEKVMEEKGWNITNYE